MLAGPGLPEAIETAVASGVDWVQVRERALDGGDLLLFAKQVAEAAQRGAARAGRAVRILVNRRVDVALALGADGVHLGYDAMDVVTARRLLGDDALVGVSAHSAAEVRGATGASYAHLAPIFAPISKAASRPPLGVDAIAEAARGAVPVIAQGGIDPAAAAAVLAAGAAGVAVTGSVLMADDVAAATRALRRELGS